MESRYSITVIHIDKKKNIRVLDNKNKTLITYIAIDESEQVDYIKRHKLENKVKAMGKVDGTESWYHLNQHIPYVMIKDPSSMSTVKVRSYLCVSTCDWENKVIHTDSRSAFNCLLIKLGQPTGIIICKEELE